MAHGGGRKSRGRLTFRATFSVAVTEKNYFGVTGFEPATSCSQGRRSSQAELHPDFAAL